MIMRNQQDIRGRCLRRKQKYSNKRNDSIKGTELTIDYKRHGREYFQASCEQLSSYL